MLKTIRLLAAALLSSPALLFSYSMGPDPRLTGAPGDQTCVLCHGGTPLNAGSGSAALVSAASATYSPGHAQTRTLTINDSKARAYGFQITARFQSDLVKGQAGEFAAGPAERCALRRRHSEERDSVRIRYCGAIHRTSQPV